MSEGLRVPIQNDHARGRRLERKGGGVPTTPARAVDQHGGICATTQRRPERRANGVEQDWPMVGVGHAPALPESRPRVQFTAYVPGGPAAAHLAPGPAASP